MEMFVYLLAILAMMSVPPVVPPALKTIPSPTPAIIPVRSATITRSPSRLITKGIFSKIASQAETAKVPKMLEYNSREPKTFQAMMKRGMLMMRFISETGILNR